jgi:hypothetical protein
VPLDRNGHLSESFAIVGSTKRLTLRDALGAAAPGVDLAALKVGTVTNAIEAKLP